MSYRLVYQGMTVECDTPADVIAILGHLAPRPAPHRAVTVAEKPVVRITTKAAAKPAPPVKAGARIVSCATCPGHFPAPSKFGPAPKYCPTCRAAGKTEDGPKSTAFKDDVALGKQS